MTGEHDTTTAADTAGRPAPPDGLSYGTPGATRPADPLWGDGPSGFRRFERTVVIGRGEDDWRTAADAVLRWEVKRRSGFSVAAEDGGGTRARLRGRYGITAGPGPFTVREPVEVVAVVETSDRCGFAYGTRHGHPVSGEEAFVVHRDGEGTVRLTLRSLTRAAPSGPWRRLFPLLLLAQRVARRRYLRALVRPPTDQERSPRCLSTRSSSGSGVSARPSTDPHSMRAHVPRQASSCPPSRWETTTPSASDDVR
ncbi:DUF1990 family protein [Streptomyces sp. NPDC002701]|uniref:DUF1990 family protein n=1 Tax=Streptomyces sp. NPDC002701 TaxID=3364661 RepID=UPI003684171F